LLYKIGHHSQPAYCPEVQGDEGNPATRTGLALYLTRLKWTLPGLAVKRAGTLEQ